LESDVRLPVARYVEPSRSAAVENDQHEPQYAWFLTSVTAPSSRQSKLSGIEPRLYSEKCG